MIKESKKQEITAPMSERFTNAILKEFTSNAGELTWGSHQKKLAQHMFIKIDTALKELESKRIYKKQTDKAPIVWENINMQKLAVDAVHRIELGLDALIPNHIHAIPYANSSTKKYDIDLRIGFEGKAYYRKAIALDPPIDVRFELVYSTDKFTPIKKSSTNDIESYTFEITNPFDRGEIIGGFGYIIYEDQSKNKLVLITPKDFERAKSAAKGDGIFWKDNTTEMKYKTVIHRTMDKIAIDPNKITEAVAAAESQSKEDFDQEVTEKSNKIVIDIDGEMVDTESGEVMEQEETKQPNNQGGPDF